MMRDMKKGEEKKKPGGKWCEQRTEHTERTNEGKNGGTAWHKNVWKNNKLHAHDVYQSLMTMSNI